MTTEEPEFSQPADPAQMLMRFSAVLATIMLLLAGLLIWRARNAGEETQGYTDASADVAADGYAEPPEFTFNIVPPAENGTTPVPAMADEVADFQLTERSGWMVSNKDLEGAPWAVCFVFTNCAGPCPRVTGQMKLLQDRFAGKPVRLVTITVDPKRDTPKRLQHYADAYGADPQQWLFLTGRQQEIYPLIRDSFGLTVQEMTGPERKQGWEITHSTRVVHVDAQGRIKGKYDAQSDVEMAALARQLEKEIADLPPELPELPLNTPSDLPIRAPVPEVAVEGK